MLQQNILWKIILSETAVHADTPSGIWATDVHQQHNASNQWLYEVSANARVLRNW